MIIRRCGFCFALFAVTLNGLFCPAQEPVLGPAEQIGSLPVATPMVVHARGLTPAQAAVLKRRLQARGHATGATHEQTMPSQVVAVAHSENVAITATSIRAVSGTSGTPGWIAQQVQQSAQLLEAAGLEDESLAMDAILTDRVLSVLNDFEVRNRDRLMLAMKRAELTRLHREIEQLAAQSSGETSAASIRLSIQLIKADAGFVEAIAKTGVNGDRPLELTMPYRLRLVDRKGYESILRDGLREKSVEIITAPEMTVQSGRAARLACDQELVITPRRLPADRVECEMVVNGTIREGAGISLRRMQSRFEMNQDQRMVIQLGSAGEDGKVQLISFVAGIEPSPDNKAEVELPEELSGERPVLLPDQFPTPVPFLLPR